MCATVGPNALQDGKAIHSYLNCATPANSAKAPSLSSLSPLKNTIIFKALISMYSRCGNPHQALLLWEDHHNAVLDKFMLSTVLTACALVGGSEGLKAGRKVHEQLKKLPSAWDETLFTSLVNMYAKCNSPMDAACFWKDFHKFNMKSPKGTLKCFLKACADIGNQEALDIGLQIQSYISTLPESMVDMALHNSLIHMLVKCGAAKRAVAYWHYLASSNSTNLNPQIATSALLACAQLGPGSLELGKSIHKLIGTTNDNMIYQAALISMYSKCGDIPAALHTWNSIAQLKPKQLFGPLLHIDTICATTLGACALVDPPENGLSIGKQIQQFAELHGCTPINNLRLCNSLILMYARCGASDMAIHHWEKLIDNKQLQPNEHSYVAILTACNTVEHLNLGIDIHKFAESHGYTPGNNLRLCNALMLMYAKCGSEQTTIDIWEKLITSNNLQPNELSYVAVLTACANLGQVAYALGKSVCSTLKFDDIAADEKMQLFGAIINMYGKCGSWEEAEVCISC